MGGGGGGGGGVSLSEVTHSSSLPLWKLRDFVVLIEAAAAGDIWYVYQPCLFLNIISVFLIYFFLLVLQMASCIMDQSFDVTASEESIHNHNICEICNYFTGDKSNFNKYMKRNKTYVKYEWDRDESTCT